MIQTIFPHYFYSIISPPNKKEIIRTLNNAPASSLDQPEWANGCEIKVESLYPQSVGSILKDTLFTYFGELGMNFCPKVELLSVWKNTYNKGYYQEIHDHHTTEGCDLSGVVFFNDWVEGASQFYFYNKFFAELPTSWLKIVNQNELTSHAFFLKPKAGDIILFPSYMLHGVTMHKINQKRTTVAFNISL
tara:strand:- start:46 stop:615 length:570 start_codon:yes stop_codon:yes gene_type:complete